MYLLDLDSCLSESKALFEKTEKKLYTLGLISTYLSIPKGRTSPSLLKGSKIFLAANINTIGPVLSVTLNPESEFKEFLSTKRAKDYIIVTEDYEIIECCQKNKLESITVDKLESLLEIDIAKYEKSVNEIDQFNNQFQKDRAKGQFLSVVIAIAIGLISFYIEEILSFIKITAIIPLSILTSSILFKLKKEYLLIYSFLELIIGLTIAYSMYHFYKIEKLDSLFKLFSLVSAIFICVRAFSNMDNYSKQNNNWFANIWNRIY